MNFTDDQITRYAQEGERMLANDTKCIQTRVSITLSQGVSEYQLPTQILGISRVTWKGFKLDPYSGEEMRNSGTTPGSTSQGRPLFYIYSELGYRTIKLLPAPSESIVASTGDLWTETEIRNAFIVQYHSDPDFTSSIVRVPSQIRRRYVKDYVLFRCLMKAGKSKDVKAAQYFKQKFEASRALVGDTVRLLHSSEDRTMSSHEFSKLSLPGRPVLPYTFGEVCE